jgi:hypothetical protein
MVNTANFFPNLDGIILGNFILDKIEICDIILS